MFGVKVSAIIPQPDVIATLAEKEGEGIVVVDAECA